MRLRRFKAPTVREAMARVRAALGEDAIIVATEETPDGVEVTAAAERVQPIGAPPGAAPEPAPSDDGLPLAERIGLRLRARLRAEARAAAPATVATAADLAELMAFHRLPETLARRIGMAARASDPDGDRSAAGTSDAGPDLAPGLADALARTFAFQPVGETLPGPVILVGPAGSGKTVTAAKLAARAVLAGQAIDFVTADSMRAGALAQARAFAGVLNQDICDVRGPDELALLLDTRSELGRRRPCLVDTPALNPFDAGELDQVTRLVQAARPAGVEPVAVLAAGGDADDAAEAAAVLRRLGCRRAIVTRCDASRRLGGLLGAIAAAGLALAGLGIKPYLAGGLVPATPERLAHLLTARARLPGAPGNDDPGDDRGDDPATPPPALPGGKAPEEHQPA